MAREYFKLIKFRYHLSFVSVILGALFFGKVFDFDVIVRLLFVYVSLNLFLYTGLYTLNDIFDRKADMLHPQKKNRPIASGKISVKKALVFTLVCFGFGLLFGFYLGKEIFYIYLLFIIFNLFYSLIAKKIPYLELLGNSLTHVLRFYLGAALVAAVVPAHVLIGILLIALGTSVERRIVEMKSEHNNSRRVLLYYTLNRLCFLEVLFFAGLIILAATDFANNFLIYILLFIYYLVFVFFINRSKKFSFIFKKIWLK